MNDAVTVALIGIITAAVAGLPATMAAVTSRKVNHAVNNRPAGSPTLHDRWDALDARQERLETEGAQRHRANETRLSSLETQAVLTQTAIASVAASTARTADAIERHLLDDEGGRRGTIDRRHDDSR